MKVIYNFTRMFEIDYAIVITGNKIYQLPGGISNYVKNTFYDDVCWDNLLMNEMEDYDAYIQKR